MGVPGVGRDDSERPLRLGAAIIIDLLLLGPHRLGSPSLY